MSSDSAQDALDAYVKSRESFAKLAPVSSALVLLMAAASRLPAWEVSSSVGWFVGSVNVGFLPIFGPIFVVGASCNVYLALRDLAELRAAAIKDTGGASSEYTKVVLRPPRGTKRRSDARFVIASRALHLWNFWVPVLAYLILMSTYFDFVRPVNDNETPRFESRSGQMVDLLVGVGGWSGFRPSLPSIQAALNERVKAAGKEDDAERLRQLARQVPWIYPPFQTWAYIGGFALLVYMSLGASQLAWSEP